MIYGVRNPFHLKNGITSGEWSVEGSGEPVTFEESLADARSQGFLEKEGAAKSHLWQAGVLVAIALLVMVGRLYYLTVVQHEYYAEIAKGNRLRVEYVTAPRGAVHDSAGEVLAGSKPSFELVASPLDLPSDPDELSGTIARVANILQVPPEEIRAALEAGRTPLYESILIKQNLPRDQALVFYEMERDLAGFRVGNAALRDYKAGEVFAHLLGYVGKINPQEYEEKKAEGYLFNDSLGKTGLEQSYEAYLRGTYGERQVEVDARGAVKRVFGEKASLPGNDVFLNVDAGLQRVLYDALLRRLTILGKRRAAALAMDPRSGKILAYISFPSYDSNLFAEGIDAKTYADIVADEDLPLFNRPVQGTYHPGSTVKPMVAAAALQEQVISANTLIEDRGQIVVPNPYGGPDSYFYGYGRRALGTMDVRSAIALSSDIFFYVVGGGYEPAGIEEGVGIARLSDYYRKFHLGAPLGIDMPGEEGGLVPDPEWKKEYFAGEPLSERWYLGDTYHVSIGQGDLLATPLQLLSWTATIASGGKIYQPYTVDRIVSADGEVLLQNEPRLLGEVPIEQKHLRVVQEGMRQAVLEGTARSLASISVPAAGKTGTAQFDARDPNRSHAWFTAYAPYDDPQIAIVVLIEDGGEGGVNAVPVVKEAMDWWGKNRNSR